MRLSKLIGGGLAVDPEITGLTAHSAEVRPGFLFAALTGSRANGADYIAAALAAGAGAILAPPGTPSPGERVALVTDVNPRRRLALIAATFFGAQPAIAVAVTGTNGKTSVASFVTQMWRHLGLEAASIGTLGVHAPGLSRFLPVTTPEPVSLHRLLAELAGRGVDHVALEASSHGLDQYRLDGVRLAAAAFTNLSHDHLDYHGAAESYLAAKSRLFGQVMDGGTAVLNADVAEFGQLSELCHARGLRVVSFGQAGADFRLDHQELVLGGQRLTLIVAGERHQAALSLVGEFQAYNVLCALALVVAAGASPDSALATIGDLTVVPGRLENVARHPSGAPVFVDYAHTPDALERALLGLRPYTERSLGVVFGCGGDRDRAKRPLMGRVAAKHADWAIVTDDNPRGEDAAAIRGEIMAGCPDADEVGDRGAAIGTAIGRLRRGDVLVVAGKGHERGQIVGGQVRPFDDAEVARACVADLAAGLTARLEDCPA